MELSFPNAHAAKVVPGLFDSTGYSAGRLGWFGHGEILMFSPMFKRLEVYKALISYLCFSVYVKRVLRYPQVLGGSEVVEPGSLRWRV